ncbi:MAG TPA: hypothetical protein VF359_06365 [Anaerolineales bacterium]
MEPMTDNAQSYPPPPPPPQRSRKGLWIGLGIGLVVLCLCCILVLVGVYFFKLNIPVLSNFFPSPTPTGLTYDNPSAGISLTYPATWQYSDSGDTTSGYTIIFASSAEILTNPSNSFQTGAIMEIFTNSLKISDLPFTVDASSMGSVVDYVATSSSISQGENPQTITVSGFPAASGIYTLPGSAGSPSTVYLVAVLRNDEIIILFGVCSQIEWSQYKPTFESIVNSAIIVTP